jgi:hypothetical protein
MEGNTSKITLEQWTDPIMARQKKAQSLTQDTAYDALLSGISDLLEAGRRGPAGP